MQHLHPAAQVAVKQRVLEDNLWHLAKVRAEQLLRPIEGPAWGYRYRARLSVRHVHRKGDGAGRLSRAQVALRGRHDGLPGAAAAGQRDAAAAARADRRRWTQRDRLPQIELAMGDDVIALVLRHLEPLPDADLARLRAFAAAHGVQWWLQPKGPDTVHRLDEGGPELAYALPEFGVHDAVQADRLHPGQPAHQPGAGAACAAPARRRSPASA